jgi:hypothetical protein
VANRVRRTARSNTPYVQTTATVMGQRQIDTWNAMCAIYGRRPHQLAADILLDGIREAQADESVQQVVRSVRRCQSRLRVVPDHW